MQINIINTSIGEQYKRKFFLTSVQFTLSSLVKMNTVGRVIVIVLLGLVGLSLADIDANGNDSGRSYIF